MVGSVCFGASGIGERGRHQQSNGSCQHEHADAAVAVESGKHKHADAAVTLETLKDSR